MAATQTASRFGVLTHAEPGFTAHGYIEAAATYRATALTSVPTMIAMILREPALLERTDLSAVSAIRMGSAPVSEGLIEAARRSPCRHHQRLRHDRGRADRLHHPRQRPSNPGFVGRRGAS